MFHVLNDDLDAGPGPYDQDASKSHPHRLE
jgi:hypothetical protein